MSPGGSPSLIGVDWGTSSLRAFLLDDAGTVLQSRAERWGIMHLPPGGFAAAFNAVTAPWRAQWPRVRAIAAGMVGSAQGWMEAPYCAAPAGVEELSAALAPVTGANLHIVPGVATRGERPDMMRGEETQIVGALERHPAFASGALLVLPGTHSKWVHVRDHKISELTTYMTGELFAVLRDHSILGRFAGESRQDADPATLDAAFARGVVAAEGSGQGTAGLLFSARALVLAERLAANASLQYLSGLLIGEELRCGLMAGVRPAALIGDAALCDRYVAALQILGICDVPVIGGTAQAGLWRIGQRAGLTSMHGDAAGA